MIYLYKGFEFREMGKHLEPVDAHPTAACWTAYHDFMRMTKIEQARYRQ